MVSQLPHGVKYVAGPPAPPNQEERELEEFNKRDPLIKKVRHGKVLE